MVSSPWSIACILLFSVPYIASVEVCAKISPCSCMFPNGTGVDLSPGKFKQVGTYAGSFTNANKTIKMRDYYYFPCVNGVIKVTDKPTSNGCEKPIAICRHQYELQINQAKQANNETLYTVSTSLNIYEALGNNTSVVFTNDGRSIVYENYPSHNEVHLECAPNAAEDIFSVDESNPDDVVFRYYSNKACMKQIKEVSTRSTGSTLLIIFFTLVLFYIVLGVGTKRCLMGAQGMEVIPNLGFWRDLPTLCRDGWVFLLNGCKVPATTSVGPTTPDPNSYDSI